MLKAKSKKQIRNYVRTLKYYLKLDFDNKHNLKDPMSSDNDKLIEEIAEKGWAVLEDKK